MSDSERIRKRLPDYFTALKEPWHFAVGLLASFVNDDEEPVGIPGPHARNLFHVAKALDEENAALRSQIEEARKEVSYWKAMNDETKSDSVYWRRELEIRGVDTGAPQLRAALTPRAEAGKEPMDAVTGKPCDLCSPSGPCVDHAPPCAHMRRPDNCEICAAFAGYLEKLYKEKS